MFSHSGDIGDIIYSLPTIRAAGGGSLVLFDYPGRTAHGMNQAKADRIKPLLELQPYISSVEFRTGIHDSSLNGFRDHWRHGNLSDMHLATHGLEWIHRSTRWLDIDHPVETYPVVIHRSSRYHNTQARFPWQEIVNKYRGKIGFCGFPDEHAVFCSEFGELPFIHADNLLGVARIIGGCELFIGNQSSPAAIAEGMKHKMILEVCPGGNQHLCIFQRMNCILGWDCKIELPEV